MRTKKKNQNIFKPLVDEVIGLIREYSNDDPIVAVSRKILLGILFLHIRAICENPETTFLDQYIWALRVIANDVPCNLDDKDAARKILDHAKQISEEYHAKREEESAHAKGTKIHKGEIAEEFFHD